MMAAFAAAFSGGSHTMEAEQPSGAPVRTTTMIETRDGTRIHFRDWGAGADRPIVFVAPWGLCSDWWDIPVTNFQNWAGVAWHSTGVVMDVPMTPAEVTISTPSPTTSPLLWMDWICKMSS